MTTPFLRRAAALVLCLPALLVATACTDLPTGADSFQLEADGELWTAVIAPEGLPTAETWLEFAATESAEGAAATEAVTSLRAAALAARAAGDLRAADAFLLEAVQRSIEVMTIDPGPGIFLSGAASLDGWERSVRSEVDLSRAPRLSATVEQVARDREAAQAALRDGDPQQAALHLTRAAERVRGWDPQGVALRVLGRVEARLAAEARSPGEGERAAHLVQSAREELLNGRALRAVQRALYALQLAGGNELREIPPEDAPSCGEYSC